MDRTYRNCKFGYLLFLKSSSSLDLPCGPLSRELGTVVSEEFILVNKELVDPKIAAVLRLAPTEFLYFASAPGAADNTLELTNPPSCKGALGGGVRLPVSGLGLLPMLYDGHFCL